MVRRRTSAELVDMRPSLSCADAVYQRKVDTEQLRESAKGRAGFAQRPHFSDEFNRQFRIPQLLSTRLAALCVCALPRGARKRRERPPWFGSAFGPHVTVVVEMRANKEVVGTYARRHVAPVAEDVSGGDWTDEQLPAIPMCIHAPRIENFDHGTTGCLLQDFVLPTDVEHPVPASSARRENSVALPQPATGTQVAQDLHPETRFARQPVRAQNGNLRTHRGVHSLGVRPAVGDTARRPLVVLNCTVKAVQWTAVEPPPS